MAFNSSVEYKQYENFTASLPNITPENKDFFLDLLVNKFMQRIISEPLVWIGMYIALGSLICTLAMTADLLHGFRHKKLWFPCKYFTLNAASLTVIAVAIKLPMDLTTQMPGYVDHVAKFGSLAFMCTIMANLLPSLATMDNKGLVSNMIALGLLVITLVANVFIQICNGVMSSYAAVGYEGTEAKIFIGMLLMLLIIYTCSSLAIIESKEILESKYESTHQKISMDQEMRRPGGLLHVEMLKKNVSNYWIMAATGSPQFMTACSVTTSASGVVCVLSTGLHIIRMYGLICDLRDYRSEYKWSLLVISIIQSVGVIVGTVAPLFRCFAALSFKLSLEWIGNRIKVFNVESYWTRKLYDMKHSSIPLQTSSPKCKFVIQNLKILIINICVAFQKTVVVLIKLIAVIPIILVIILLCYFHCWKWLKAIVLRQTPKEQVPRDNDSSPYVLQLQDDMEFPKRTLKSISKSVNHLIKESEKLSPKKLMKLLAESRNFEGVEMFDSHHVQPLLSEEFPTCWSLTLVTLTTIAVSLPNMQRNLIDSLLRGVSEGLVYVTLIEKSLNAAANHVSIQKAAKTLWLEVEVYNKWLGNKLPNHAPRANTAGQILLWLRDTAKIMVTEFASSDTGVLNDKSKRISICANSMYRITETVLVSYHEEIDQVSQEEIFKQLSSMIADILAACLTNLPQLIAMKWHTSAIEKREASVYAAARLLGETMQIINTLKEREIPNLNPDELAYIDMWRNYLKDNQFP